MPNDPERVAVVTGGSRGIGLAVVRKLVGDGFLVAACSRHPSPALPTGDEGDVRFFQLDLADPNSVKECAQALHRQYQRIDALVNCAGVAAGGLFSMARLEDLKRIFDVNYFNQILFSQYVAKRMVRAKAGSIVNIASTAGLLSDAGTLAYGGSKAALIHATKVMATELGPFGIRVNAIAPAVVETDMAIQMDEKARTALDERSALQGVVEVADVAELVAYLVSDASSKMTGQILRLDRGLH
ncbi:SDR family NAD(P)-dependent oxidoreductase (plasmid) [Rhizobium leguminosarum]|jgi:3-oxoacyl-[acyl-carrier protein] reductase|uniref:3-oxoacyl-ACP reductase n=2 Tax=Rhizobium TaxID=379 RepID=A0A1B8RK89_RHILT|nr:SDR family oxidoreductase [Rhizobium leguminosarum]AOO87829.1 3-oxoacyl-ACP reductase [Rhizobium leguminosarum bv. trifolii]MBA8832429.1 3-oxoacyl-[acyl-carrier protein] reductase [Rhizobium leguminosarum]MBY5914520.1 SDR family oxidoreductase [Rhizobium leguminosarum]MDH6275050.1 3-oxoacyl-[acyl-carrier protein] reductase [Rhizobium leguminosarum]MVO92513.1 SDR family oxidoreductase [Rhizobium leguminosarum bv. phaseoli]